MGGLGSGRHGRRPGRKLTVEECCQLDVNRLASDGLMESLGLAHYCFTYTGTLQSPDIVVSVEEGLYTDSRRVCRISDHNGDNPTGTTVKLDATFPLFGGAQWWFLCPVIGADGKSCGRRVAKLYLRNGKWGCRTCHGLTYRSAQRSHVNERYEHRIHQLLSNGPSLQKAT